jgi:hypothetical protein
MFRSALAQRWSVMMQRRQSPSTVPNVERARRAKRRSRGVVMVEYALLLVGFGVPVMVGTALAGLQLIKVYGDIRNDQLHIGP